MEEQAVLPFTLTVIIAIGLKKNGGTSFVAFYSYSDNSDKDIYLSSYNIIDIFSERLQILTT
jgi:hypothetical protein